MWLVLALALAPLLPQRPERAAPDRERVLDALAALEESFAKGTAEQRVEAVRQQGEVPDAKVVDWLEKALRSQEPELRQAAVQALRYQAHPDALELLERTLRRDRSLRDEPELHAALVKAIGQHGSEGSIDLLADDLWAVRDEPVVQARILALGHIRSAKSARALFALMRKESRERVQQRIGEFRLALVVLLGVDEGDSQDAWTKWWNDHGAKLVVAPEEPLLPQALARRWASFWGRAPARERPPKRGDRGRE